MLARSPIKKGLAHTRAQTAVHFLLQPRPKTVFYPKLNNISACREITANEGDRINKANFTGTISTIKTLNSKTTNTRSYPSGHSAQSMLVAKYVIGKFPKHEKRISITSRHLITVVQCQQQ